MQHNYIHTISAVYVGLSRKNIPLKNRRCDGCRKDGVFIFYVNHCKLLKVFNAKFLLSWSIVVPSLLSFLLY